jgi:hypothetical protein
VRDGVNGLLVEPDAPLRWRNGIRAPAAEPGARRGLRPARPRHGRESLRTDDANLRTLLPAAGAGRTSAAPIASLLEGRRDEAQQGRLRDERLPCLSETFIANEIHQLERLGLEMRLYSVKDEREPVVHPVVGAIRAPLTYLPEATSLSATTLRQWLRDNLGTFWAAHAEVARRRPRRGWPRWAPPSGWAWKHRSREAGRALRAEEGLHQGIPAGRWIAQCRAAGRGRVAPARSLLPRVATITWFASRLSGLPFSFTAHAKDIYQTELNPAGCSNASWARRASSPPAPAPTRRSAGRHPRPDDVHAIYHGLDTDWFSPRVRLAREEAPLLLAVGRWWRRRASTAWWTPAPCCAAAACPSAASSWARRAAPARPARADRRARAGGVRAAARGCPAGTACARSTAAPRRSRCLAA